MVEARQGSLQRQVGVFGAVMLGLGSIVGTGVFVTIAMGVELAGSGVVIAIALAAVVATCNGLSSAQLAAAHPVSGGTYEYGYRLLHPALGFTAGWMFLCAKSASAATAALGFAGYLLGGLDLDARMTIPAALFIVVTLTVLVCTGIKRSNVVNIVIVSVTLGTLGFFVAVGGAKAVSGGDISHPLASLTLGRGLFEAAALMFVAFTGYGRIATMGEEITDPRKNIPRAMIVTLVVSMLLYVAVGAVYVALGQQPRDQSASEWIAPLAWAAEQAAGRTGAMVLGIGAVTAMAGVLLNLLLGLSRILLAMGRRGDAPACIAHLSPRFHSPNVAILTIGAAIAALVLIGDVKTTWSFSAFTVLIYYAMTNAAALRLPREARLFNRAWAWGGLASCLFLAFWVEPRIWLVGLGLIAGGLVWHVVARKMSDRVGR